MGKKGQRREPLVHHKRLREHGGSIKGIQKQETKQEEIDPLQNRGDLLTRCSLIEFFVNDWSHALS